MFQGSILAQYVVRELQQELLIGRVSLMEGDRRPRRLKIDEMERVLPGLERSSQRAVANDGAFELPQGLLYLQRMTVRGRNRALLLVRVDRQVAQIKPRRVDPLGSVSVRV